MQSPIWLRRVIKIRGDCSKVLPMVAGLGWLQVFGLVAGLSLLQSLVQPSGMAKIDCVWQSVRF